MLLLLVLGLLERGPAGVHGGKKVEAVGKDSMPRIREERIQSDWRKKGLSSGEESRGGSAEFKDTPFI